MSSISSVTTPALATISSGPGDNGSTVAGATDFDDILKQLYAIEDECSKAVGQLTQKVEQLAKNSESATETPATPTATLDASSMPVSSLDIQPSRADAGSSAASLASYMKAMQSYTKAQVLPDLNASLLFSTDS